MKGFDQSFDTPADSQEEHWVSVSDLMAGLMMCFLMISVVFMIKMQIEKEKIQEVALLYETLRTSLYDQLYDEFKDDLPRWGAELDEDLTFRFTDSQLLFDKGKSELKPEFSAILKDFFPRYTKIITSPAYYEAITEVRIEGHTSIGWGKAADKDTAYILNMRLSQARTRTTLAYLLLLPEVYRQKDWLRDRLTANGLSSSHPVIDAQGNIDNVGSRRVEFRLRTDAESRIADILDRIR
jgi:outer membrane protein OmpA-like peptidoglycan-associated protein